MNKRDCHATSAQIDELLCSILRGEAVAWPASADAAYQEQFLAACDLHGVSPLIQQRLSRTRAWQDWPVRLQQTLAHHCRMQAALALLRERELTRVLVALSEHGVSPLLMKGAPLAYTHYAAPHLRTRCDTDLLVWQQDVEVVQQVLSELNYTRLNAVSGKLIMHQCTYVKEDRYGARHALDVHWKVSNPYPFSEFLSYHELARQAIAVPALGKHARALPPVQALLLACVHRVAHHGNSERLIWLYDIHLLASRMTHDERAIFIQLAADRRLRAVCGSGLQLAQQRFATVLPVGFVQTVCGHGALSSEATTSRFLKPNQRHLHTLLGDLRALSGWQNKICLLKEHLFPPPAYLLDRYATTRHAWLPLLYIQRAIQGAWKAWQRVR